jgi:FSR family fosmidomycin resistance protein-like MFS transporter
MSVLLDPVFLAVSLIHLGVDVLNGTQGVLLAYLSGPLGLSNTVLGAVSTAYIVTGAVSQPVFGYFADRIGSRWVAVGGMFWLAGFYTLAVLTPGRAALGFLVVAALGSGAFHPAGTMQATQVGRTRFSQRETTSTSYFFLMGQLGLFMGPLLSGFLLAGMGSPGLLLLTAPALPIGFNAVVRLGRVPKQPRTTSQEGPGQKPALRYGAGILTALALLAGLRAWVQQNINTFLPKHLSDLGYTPDAYGLVVALFMGGSAIGNVVGGMLADRYGRRRVAVWTLALSVIPLGLLPFTNDLAWLRILVPLAGALSGATHSIVVVFAQRIIPGGMGMASGLILGFMFSAGALGTLMSGFLADLWGIPLVFGLSAILALASAGFAGILQDG